MPLFAPSAYRHTQSTPSTTWSITHNLGNNGSTGIPIVDAMVDVGGQVYKTVPFEVTIIDKNTVELTFTVAREGFATVVV